MSDCPRCFAEPCACQLPASRHPRPAFRNTYTPQERGISLEEFGIDLFNAIKSVGGIQALDEQIRHHRHDGIKRAEAQTRRMNLLQRLKEQRDQLTVEQTLELVERYPWVAHV
jgi:hypothetical protein